MITNPAGRTDATKISAELREQRKNIREELNREIVSEKIAITSGAGTLVDVPYANPDDGFFAVGVVALKWDVRQWVAARILLLL